MLPSLSIQNFCKVAIKEAIIHGVFIERACRAQLELCASGLPWTPPAMDKRYIRSFDQAGQGESAYIDNSFDYFDRSLTRSERVWQALADRAKTCVSPYCPFFRCDA